MALIDVAEISIIIDDSNKTSFKIDLNNFDEEILSTICNDISTQYHLSSKATEKIYHQALTEITNVRNTLYCQQLSSNQDERNDFVNRLYYEGTKKKKEQKKKNEIMLQEKINNEIKQYPFCPNVNKQSDKRNRILNQHKYKEGNEFKITIPNNRVNTTNTIEVNDSKLKQRKKMNFNMQNKIKKANKNKENANQIIKTNNNYHSCSSNDEDIYYCDLRTKGNTNTMTINNQSNSTSTINHKKELKRAKSINSTHEINQNKNNSNNSFNKSAKSICNSKQLAKPFNSNSNPIPLFESPKTEKSSNIIPNDSKWFERLYNTKAIVQNKKEEMINRFYQFQCPFEPKLSKGSKKIMNQRKESAKSMVNRLSSSKVYTALSNSIKTISNKTEANNTNQSKVKRSFSLSSINPTNKNTSFISLSQKTIDPNRKRITEQRSERDLLKSIYAISKNNENSMKYYQSTVNRNAERYKISTMKDIYEIISTKAQLDFNDLPSYGIPKHIVDKVVIPTCYMITNKQLEFNFQNFYLIASEMLNKYF